VKDLVESALMLLDSPAERERVLVTIQPGTPTVYVDRNEMEQVFSRTMYSALAATEGDQRIALSAAPSEDNSNHVQVSVRARGLSIQEDDMAVVFGPSAAMLSERPSSGRALGLAVAKALVELHGGHMWLDERDGSEPAICFTLPKYRSEGSAPAVIVGSEAGREQGAESNGTGEIDDSGRRPVGTEAGA
jgi:signal transduction histidine kinase